MAAVYRSGPPYAIIGREVHRFLQQSEIDSEVAWTRRTLQVVSLPCHTGCSSARRGTLSTSVNHTSALAARRSSKVSRTWAPEAAVGSLTVHDADFSTSPKKGPHSADMIASRRPAGER